MDTNESHDQMSWEQAVRWYCSQPGNSDWVKGSFFDDDVVEAATRFSESSEFAETVALLPASCRKKGTRLLDVGSGRGIAAYAFATRGFDVWAIEPDPSGFVGAGAIRELARATGTSINIATEWGEQLPFPDHAFDVVYARQVLHHAKDLRQLCREAFRVLRPGGVFVAVREHVIQSDEDLPRFLEQHPLHALYGGEHAYTLDTYETAMTEAGFAVARTLRPLETPINYHPRSPLDAIESGFRASLARIGVTRGAGLLWRTFGKACSQAWPAMGRRWFQAAQDMYTPGNIYSFVCEKRTATPLNADS